MSPGVLAAASQLAHGPLIGVTAGEREPATFESDGAGAPLLNSSSNYARPGGDSFRIGPCQPDQFRVVVEGAIDGATVTPGPSHRQDGPPLLPTRPSGYCPRRGCGRPGRTPCSAPGAESPELVHVPRLSPGTGAPVRVRTRSQLGTFLHTLSTDWLSPTQKLWSRAPRQVSNPRPAA